jgi:hypothetical protein
LTPALAIMLAKLVVAEEAEPKSDDAIATGVTDD